MVTASSRSFIWWVIRRHFKGGLGVGIGLGLIVLITGPAWVAEGTAVAGGIARLGAQATPVAKQVAFLTGPVSDIGTVGGYLSYKVFGSALIVLGIYAAILGSASIRGAEEKGLIELWEVAGLTPSRIVAVRVGVAAAVITFDGICIWLGTVLGGALSKVNLVGPAVAQCVALTFLSLGILALAFVVSQLTVDTKMSTGVAVAYLVITYAISNTTYYGGGWTWLHAFSLYEAYLVNRTLVPGSSPDVAALLLLLLVAIVLAGIGLMLYARRDIHGSALSVRTTKKRRITPMRRSKLARRWLSVSWLSEQPFALVAWWGGMAAIVAIEVDVAPSIHSLLKAVGTGHGAKVADKLAHITTRNTSLDCLRSQSSWRRPVRRSSVGVTPPTCVTAGLRPCLFNQWVWVASSSREPSRWRFGVSSLGPRSSWGLSLAGAEDTSR